MSMKFDLSNYLNPVFLETGTYHGGGVRQALKAGFERIVTIEIHEPYIEENTARFQQEIRAGRVSIIQGDTAEVLADALRGLEGPITFWLDAHTQYYEGGVGKKKCPVVEELEQIRALRAGQPDTLLIDDLRLIEDRNVGWAVNLGELYRLVWEIRPDYRITRIEGHVPHDVLACVPGRE